jgi:hypothetical protein
MEAKTLDKKNIDRVRSQNPIALAALSAILYQEDPIAINLGINPDEYDGEAAAILPRLWECSSAAAVNQVIHDEFVYAFGADIAGPVERYEKVAHRVWMDLPAWLDYPLERPTSGGANANEPLALV